jgi:succinate dehydrogenase / fumarate reductase flavoprotein subunit
VPRDVASRAIKREVDAERGVGPLKNGVYLDFSESIHRLGRTAIAERYGNLFEMYERITDEDPFRVPMRIYPAVHYTMGGLWVDYDLMSNVPGLFVLGEANFSDHGANRLGASALMQGLADGYFVLPYTIGDYLAPLLGSSPVGMARSRESLEKALGEIPALRDEFHRDVRVLGDAESMNQALERAGRVSDFLEFAELLCLDALHREESCGGHFRIEHQTEDGEALRDDARFAYAAGWEFRGVGSPPRLHREPLTFENVHLAQRSYK